MAQRALHTGKGKTIRRTIAAVVSATVFTIGGCGRHPQCEVNYKPAVAEECVQALESVQKARDKLRELAGYKEMAGDKLKEKIDGGEAKEGELERYQEILRELTRISKGISDLGKLRRATEEGTADRSEIENTEREARDLLKRMEGLKTALREIINAN